MCWIAAGHLENYHLSFEIDGHKMGGNARIDLVAHHVIDLCGPRISIVNIVNESTTPAHRHQSSESKQQSAKHPQSKRQEPAAPSWGRFRLEN
ncbi:hypothetical protein KSD_01630 [Ktedonobacter sp. SOSP1-85]|nr:hypothetical protein KSD_01630 [Ktedonobacter sp. SOSP1-85]